MASLLATVMVINAVLMLASLRAWFHLPNWVGLRGSLTEKRFSTGLGAIQIRLTGAAILALIGYIVYDLLLSR